VDTFGDVTSRAGGQLITQAQALRNVVTEGVLAEQVGIGLLRRRRASSGRFCGVRSGGRACGDSRTHGAHPLDSAVTVLSSE
jgi:hypothetical protein